MRPTKLLKDDRLFRLEIRTWSELKERSWAVITFHNLLFGYLPARQDYFASREDALAYYLKIVVETPRVSLDNHPPDPLPSIEKYTIWLKAENIYDPVLNPGDLPDPSRGQAL